MKKLFPLLIFSLALLFTACSGESEETQQEEDTTAEVSDVRTIDIYGIDRMKYVVKEEGEGLQTGETVQVNGETYYLLEGINAEPGEELTVKLTTISKLPANSMAHNWLLLGQDSDVQAFADASLQAADNDYVAPDMEDMLLQKTGLVAGGETEEVTFNAPEETGDYEYICTFPGHFGAGMRGTLSVQ